MLFQLKKKKLRITSTKALTWSYTHKLKSNLKAVQLFIQTEVKGTTSQREMCLIKLINKKLSTRGLGSNEPMKKEILCGIILNSSKATCT